MQKQTTLINYLILLALHHVNIYRVAHVVAFFPSMPTGAPLSHFASPLMLVTQTLLAGYFFP